MLTGNPGLKILYVCPYDFWHKEEDLHIKFEDFRHDREWFSYTVGLKRFLEKEIEKSRYVIDLYNKKKEVEEMEKVLLQKLS